MAKFCKKHGCISGLSGDIFKNTPGGERVKDEIPVKLISKHKDTQQAKEQSHSCSFCLKTFSNNSHLIRSIKTHVVTDFFECDDCGEKFSRKDNLQTHVRKYHLKTFDDVNIPSTTKLKH